MTECTVYSNMRFYLSTKDIRIFKKMILLICGIKTENPVGNTPFRGQFVGTPTTITQTQYPKIIISG